jgi:superfamily II DNA or RNA helicase
MSLANVNFSAPIRIDTKYGSKYMRKWIIPDDKIISSGFWEFWKNNKTKMLAKGFSIYNDKKTGKWELQEWHENLDEFPIYESKPELILSSSLNPPELSKSDGLREWQKRSVSYLAESIRVHGAAIDGSDTGTGKTYAAIGTVRELGMDVGVLCPKAVIESWKRVIKDHFNLPCTFVYNYEALKSGKLNHILEKRRSKNSTNEEYVWNIPKNTLLIFDESHRLKGKDTKNSLMAKAAKNQGYKILCCSATNAVNPIELDAVGYILGLHKSGNSFIKFIKDHGCKKGHYGYRFDGGKYWLQKLHKDIFLDRGVRLKKDDIPNFPDSEIIAEPYCLGDAPTEEINRIYFEMNKEIETLNNVISKKKATNELTIRLRARQKIELLKVPLFVEMTEDLLEDGHSVVIMVNFEETIQALSKKLKTRCMIYGGNKGNERQQNIDDFQADKQRVILVNIAAGGVGVSLHDLNGNHPRVALISPNDSAPILRQAFGRVHRDGAKTKSQQRVIFVANTVEEQVCTNVKMKLNNLDTINDGDLDPKFKGMLKE